MGIVGPALAVLVVACAGSDGLPRAGGADTAASVPGYRTVADVPLPGGSSRWGYPVLDARAGRLYLAHSGAGQVVVVDTVQQRVVATVTDIDAVHGLTLAAANGLLYASATASDEVAVIDLASMRVVARVAAGRAPDALTYVSSPNRLFVTDDGGTGETVVDAGTNKPHARVDLGAGLGDSQYDPWTGRVLVAAGADHELVALDPATSAVVARYPLPGCEDADGLQVDASSFDRAFVACAGNARLVTVDLNTGHVSAPLEVGVGPDVLGLDPTLHRLYVASESGVLTVIDTGGAEPAVIARGEAGPNAHSVAVDPDTHLVYLPLPGPDGRSILRVLAPQ
jgi:DNA-binding beta-propeller fold protein YncE